MAITSVTKTNLKIRGKGFYRKYLGGFTTKNMKGIPFTKFKGGIRVTGVKSTARALLLFHGHFEDALYFELYRLGTEIMKTSAEMAPDSYGKPWEGQKNQPGNLKKSTYVIGRFSGDDVSDVERGDPNLGRREAGRAYRMWNKSTLSVNIMYQGKKVISSSKAMKGGKILIACGYATTDYALPVHELHPTHSQFLRNAITQKKSSKAKMRKNLARNIGRSAKKAKSGVISKYFKAKSASKVLRPFI